MRQAAVRWGVVCGVLAMLVLPARADSAEKKIVHLELKGAVSEAPVDDPLGLMSKKHFTTKTLIDRLKKMRQDNEVDAVYVTFENFSMGLAQVQELRQAFDQLKKADK